MGEEIGMLLDTLAEASVQPSAELPAKGTHHSRDSFNMLPTSVPICTAEHDRSP
jgi:hypothetical protein